MFFFPIFGAFAHTRNDVGDFGGDLADFGGFGAEFGVWCGDYLHVYRVARINCLEQGGGVEVEVEVGVCREGSDDIEEKLAFFGFDDELPVVAAVGAFVKSGHGWGDDDGLLRRFAPRNDGSEGGDVFDAGVFGFVGEGEFEKEGIGGEGGAAAVLYDVVVETLVVAGGGELDDGVVWLVGLDDDVGILVAAVGASDDLGEELEGALFGGKIWKGEAGVGLDDAEGGEVR